MVIIKYTLAYCGKWTICVVYILLLPGKTDTFDTSYFKDAVLKERIYLIVLGQFKTFILTNDNLRANS